MKSKVKGQTTSNSAPLPERLSTWTPYPFIFSQPYKLQSFKFRVNKYLVYPYITKTIENKQSPMISRLKSKPKHASRGLLDATATIQWRRETQSVWQVSGSSRGFPDLKQCCYDCMSEYDVTIWFWFRMINVRLRDEWRFTYFLLTFSFNVMFAK